MEEKLDEDFGKYNIVLLDEGEMNTIEWLKFKINDKSYQIFLYVTYENGEIYRVAAISHLKSECVLCKEAVSGHLCNRLYEQRKEIFEHLVPQSKYRLKWIARNVI